MAPSVDNLASRLSRRLASERAQVAAYRFVDAVMRQWDGLSVTGGDVVDVVSELWPRDTFLPNRDLALEYLQHCRARDKRPDRGILTGCLLPWFVDA